MESTVESTVVPVVVSVVVSVVVFYSCHFRHFWSKPALNTVRNVRNVKTRKMAKNSDIHEK